MDIVKLVNCEINIQDLIDFVSSPACGATSIFIGHTRDNFNGKKVNQLVYEAYEPMANQALLKICATIREKWTVHGIAIYHRLGVVPVKESSVAIAISSEHRAESLLAVQFAIGQLKADVPIWKKEVYEGDAPPQWKENKECPWIKSESIDLTDCDDMVSNEEDPIDTVPAELIQIKASGDEVKRRIDSFIDLKRKQVNTCNIIDFCTNIDPEYSCARVDAVLVRQKDSKGHVRVRRVENITGPQLRVPSVIKSEILNSSGYQFNQVAETGSGYKTQNVLGAHSAIEERLQNAEVHLGLSKGGNPPVSKDIYARLKLLEDRILQLEGLSPEYVQFWLGAPKIESNTDVKSQNKRKKIFSTADLDEKLREFDDC